MAKRKRLKVLMNGELVGWLQASSKGVLSFAYDLTWLKHKNVRPLSLSLPLTTETYAGPLVENYFDNLLPDNLSIRRRLQARVGADSTRPFDLLCHIGRDCVGALQLLPEDQDVEVRQIEATPLSEKEVESILKGYRVAPLGVYPEADFRISVAGAQEKTALLHYNGQWNRPSGTTPTSHILKLPIGELGHTGIDLSDSIENEWLCLKLLESFSLPVASTKIVRFGQQKVLAVERFDRRWSRDSSWLMRLPQEDICQATGTAGTDRTEGLGLGTEELRTARLEVRGER